MRPPDENPTPIERVLSEPKAAGRVSCPPSSGETSDAEANGSITRNTVPSGRSSRRLRHLRDPEQSSATTVSPSPCRFLPWLMKVRRACRESTRDAMTVIADANLGAIANFPQLNQNAADLKPRLHSIQQQLYKARSNRLGSNHPMLLPCSLMAICTRENSGCERIACTHAQPNRERYRSSAAVFSRTRKFKRESMRSVIYSPRCALLHRALPAGRMIGGFRKETQHWRRSPPASAANRARWSWHASNSRQSLRVQEFLLSFQRLSACA